MGGSGSSSGKGGSSGGAKKIALSQIEVNKNEYLFSWGKRPSGRGDWALTLVAKHISSTELIQKPLKKPRRKHKKKDKGE